MFSYYQLQLVATRLGTGEDNEDYKVHNYRYNVILDTMQYTITIKYDHIRCMYILIQELTANHTIVFRTGLLF